MSNDNKYSDSNLAVNLENMRPVVSHQNWELSSLNRSTEFTKSRGSFEVITSIILVVIKRLRRYFDGAEHSEYGYRTVEGTQLRVLGMNSLHISQASLSVIRICLYLPPLRCCGA